MEPTTTSDIIDYPSDRQLWGPRPVLWGLRMLGPAPLAMFKALSADEQREATNFLGISLSDDGKHKNTATQLQAKVEDRRRAIDSDIGAESILYTNLLGLQKELGLSEVDLDLIAFRAMLRLHPGFEALAGKYVGLCCDLVFHRKLARLFDRPAVAITKALAPSGLLVRSGLADVEDGLLGPLERRFYLSRGLIAPLAARQPNPAELLNRLLPVRRDAHLNLAAYPHLAHETELLASYLRASLDAGTPGVNVLLHGRPGTGKSELAAALAASLQCSLYPSEPAPEDGESLTPRERLRSLARLQKVAHVRAKSIVLIDEAEDVFPTIWSDSEKTPSKAAVNECLETNPVPTIWISNRAEDMDEAFLRRFDLVIKVPPLPTRSKRALLKQSLPAGTLDEGEMRRYANQRELSPAMITRMTRVAACEGDQGTGDIRARLEVLSSHYLRTLGVIPATVAKTDATLAYDLDLMNCEPPLGDVAQAMEVASFGARMLLHGAPGTGKTAFGKALAERLDKPLLQRQASSLLSCYLGDTEKNIRDMFEEAQLEGGILLVDEADSFLRNRDQAKARWEVTQTNEFLTQMENFDGIFLCTTNRLTDLDPAALRRFDFKVECRPLLPEQRVLLVRRCCTAIGLDTIAGEDRWVTRARQLDGLTPGDAAAALRRLRFSASVPSVAMLIAALANECRYKPATPKPIGFAP